MKAALLLLLVIVRSIRTAQTVYLMAPKAHFVQTLFYSSRPQIQVAFDSHRLPFPSQ